MDEGRDYQKGGILEGCPWGRAEISKEKCPAGEDQGKGIVRKESHVYP